MSRATVIAFPKPRQPKAAPDYRLPSAAYYVAVDALMLVEDLAFRIAEAPALGPSKRRQLARRADAIADLLGQALDSTEHLP